MAIKRSAAVIFALVTSLMLAAGGANAQVQGIIKDVEVPIGTTGKVDWTTEVVTSVGIGAPPASPTNPGQARDTAERAALAAAYRNLLEAVKGVRVDDTTLVENFIVTSGAIKTEVNGIIQGAMVMDKKYMPDGSVEITIGMKVTGALADALLPKAPAAPPVPLAAPDNRPAAGGQLYTGLVIDTRGLNVKPAMAPKVLNEDGKEVYGSSWINRDYAVREGMVGYMKDPAAAQADPRVADKPMMIKAVRVSGDARVDTVISNADAVMLQSASQNLSMLQKCRVIILVD